jgi:hypothetical protein
VPVALATWKDLCLDASDSRVLAGFWAAALGLEHVQLDPAHAVLRGDRPGSTIWVNAVPEPKTVKHRVHLDVSVADVAPLVELGARVLAPPGESGGRWHLMADPEGGEFCAFARDEHPDEPPATLFEVVVDTASSASSQQLAGWWAEVLGGVLTDDGRGFWWVEAIPGAPFDSLDLIPVPEPKTTKNRVHWDVVCDDVDALVVRGATVLATPAGDRSWHVLADPQGDEFCVFPSST